MKTLIIIISIGVAGCCSTGKTSNNANSQGLDSSSIVSGKEMNYEADTSLPVCVKELISKFKKEEKQNPPRSVYQYTYNGKTVYYVPAICCDFFSDLYDSNCKLIGHPDGGFTGRGDGTVTDFSSARTNEKLLWNDERK